MKIFAPYKIKDLELKNKVVMAPMCQYSATDGYPNAWHHVHYTTRAVGGVGFIVIEMTNVEPDGRITDNCLGLWEDGQIEAFKGIIDSVHAHGAKVSIQIAHAGRKATDAETPVSASDIRYSDKYKTPRALSTEEVYEMIEKFGQSARRAIEAGVDSIEIHGAHGYLIHQFSSKRTNNRTDEFGEDLSLFGRKVIERVKEEIPEGMPLAIRMSAKEYATDGYDLSHGVYLAEQFKNAGVDFIHVSAGGEGQPDKERLGTVGPGYMVPFAKEIKEKVDIPVIAVGILDDVKDAEAALESTDLVALGRALLRDPYWVANYDDKHRFAAKQYERGY